MKPTQAITKALLRELDTGFSYETLDKLEAICALYLKKAEPQNKLFYYALRGICFELKSHIDSHQPVEAIIHDSIEATITKSLKDAIKSFQGSSIPDQVEFFNQLIINLEKAKQIKSRN
jgi:hypothetical protein